MKLSEAIRLGAMMKPQCRNVMFCRSMASESYLVPESCALGAALDAIGLGTAHETQSFGEYASFLEERWPILLVIVGEDRRLIHEITSLNDRGFWTREDIADYVEKFENAHESRQNALTEAPETPMAPR